MDRLVNIRENLVTADRENGEKGSALVIALFVLALISVFVAFALSRTAAEAAAVGNETAEARTLYAAQGSLEVMTRNFNKVFERKLNPSATDLAKVEDPNIIPGISRSLGGDFDLENELDQVSTSTAAVLSGGPYAGLFAIRDTWRLRTTVTDTAGTQIQLTRNVLNNRIPIFQFGIFYDDDLELFRPPRFSFGGRVHSNRHFFVSPGTEGVYFDSRVTAAGHIVTQTWRNWYTGDSANNQTWIKNASGTFRQLLPDRGSVVNGTPNVFGSGKWADPDLPSSRVNTNWATQSAIFDGNLRSEVKQLKLPLKVGNNTTDLVDMIKRGREIPGAAGGDLAWNGSNVVPVSNTPGPAQVDTEIQRSERFANKTGIRVSLADSKAKLPGCASGVGTAAVTTPCGVRLDGHKSGQVLSTDPTAPLSLAAATSAGDVGLAARGYQPKPMLDGYQATRVNGERLYAGREVWIKVELVSTNDITDAIETKDVTEDILSLGVTEEAPSWMGISGPGGCTRADLNNGVPTSATQPMNMTATAAQTPFTCIDSRSVIKLQRWSVPGTAIPKTTGTPFVSSVTTPNDQNYVRRYTNATAAKISYGCPTSGPVGTTCTDDDGDPTITQNERYGHLKLSGTEAVVPFPIKMFDSREGEYFDDAARYTAGQVTRNGVMSMVDIDVANMRRFLRGDFNGRFPTNTDFASKKGSALVASFGATSDVPQREGWVLYVSDRRGDDDFDGEFDMEDIYGSSPGNDGVLQLGEDINFNSVLDAKYIHPTSGGCIGSTSFCEAPKYQDNWMPDYAAVMDHKYFRRGVRLINGTTLPGIYDAANPSSSRGFTVASENGIYVKGNYNATHVTSVPSTGNTPFDNYRPIDNAVHIPASIVADGVTILSNNWKDAESFRSPYNKETSPGYRQATETTIRFAMISGDTIATREMTPHQGGISPRLNGGVHNFKRFLEKWTGDNLNYSGSLINLFNSRNNNGAFKCCNTVYDPPYRNWVFDATFLDPARIPPGTPFFQYVQTTGFERATD